MLTQAGLLTPTRPDRLLGMALALARWGLTPATGYAAGAARHPQRVAIVDDEGALTYREVDQRTDRLAGELRARGVHEGHAVGLLARNGRGFVEGSVALSKCGADVLYLNTGMAGGQLAEVLHREGATGVVHDEEFTDLLALAAPGRVMVTTQELGALAGTSTLPAPPKTGHVTRLVLLTSGTTGPPRGASRSGASIDDAVSVLSRIPLRAGETTVIASPVFHAWGLGHLAMAMLLGSTVVLQKRFDPAGVLQAVEGHRATALMVVPVMLDLLLSADPSSYDLSALRVVASSGSALPGQLATRVLESFGPVLYNLYGSTEVAYAAVAGPDDLAADPHTAGKAPYGVTLRVVDDLGAEVPAGIPGRVFVGSTLAFGGYTDGSDKDRLDGLISTGDLGVLDPAGRLTVLGRDDDMVVIGGENVYPGQVEDVLLGHPDVKDVAITAASDPVFGVRLVAHVVGDVAPEELASLVRNELARFAVPREFRFVDALPRNATGKVLKRELS
ncbi:MAG: AMP-dependent synthetase and ligase [Frankiales bacterium]|nr:AMP-dependent synthetase and ligase [Frankiales bacterium]